MVTKPILLKLLSLTPKTEKSAETPVNTGGIF